MPEMAPQGEDILYVEDNPFDVDLTLRTLRQCGMGDRVVVARDGAEAIDYLCAAGAYAHRLAEDQPRLVLLDLKLPKISGVQVLQWIRADARTRNIPVVVLTSFENDRDVVEVYKLGVNGYLLKPLDREGFLKIAGSLGVVSPARAG
jgi:CheY-like chemotaxis protein